jgi:hypothetical protein
LYSKEVGCGSWKARRGSWKARRGPRKAGRGRKTVPRGRKKVPRARKKVPRGRKMVGRGRKMVGRGRKNVGRGRKNVGCGRKKVPDPGKPVAAPSYSVVYISQENKKKRCKCYYKGFYTLNMLTLASLRGVKVKSSCCGASAPSSSPFIRSAKKFFLKGSLRKYKSYQVFNFISSAAMAQLASRRQACSSKAHSDR